ncbi:TetR/AcrR family transcriptional regulator [Planctomycetota bacterium]|nr:TetR/AcrR family transcriptional regulator [Planctomycetota bacterium]
MVTKSESKEVPSNVKQRWNDASPDERREIIVDVAIDILDEQGIDRVTIRRVASQIGVGAMTLYTYIDGQQGLRTAIIDRGFELMDEHCHKNEANSSHTTNMKEWITGCTSYINFAIENPSLYSLMFSHKVDEHELEAIRSHFSIWRSDVEKQYREIGVPEKHIDRIVEHTTSNCWMAMHGLASLIISKRLLADEDKIKQHITDLITRLYAPPEELFEDLSDE